MTTIDFSSITYPAIDPSGVADDAFGVFGSVGQSGKLHIQADFDFTHEDVYLIPYLSIGGDKWTKIDDNGEDFKIHLFNTPCGAIITDLIPGTRFRFGLEKGSIEEGDVLNVKIST
jgi:hypothetical protein